MNHKRGFTIVELMIAIVFVSLLLLAIAVFIMQIGSMYNKGVTLKAVNQAGLAISRDMQRGLNQSTNSVVYIDNVLGAGNENGVGGGRLCTGAVSYAWNYPDSIATANTAMQANMYKDESDSTEASNLRLVKIADKEKTYCTPEDNDGSPEYPDIPRQGSFELLAAGDRNLAIHSLNYQSNTVSAGQQMHWVQAVIGTNNQGELLAEGDNGYIEGQSSCRPNEGYESWCSVNVFQFVARSGNVNGGEN